MSLYQDIYDIVKRIPPGTVTSYGRIAKMVDCNARQVGYAMAATPPGQNIPWHRVVNSKGEISARTEGDSDHRQRKLLLAEGVIFDKNNRISFKQYGWAEAELPFLPEDWPDPDDGQMDLFSESE